MNLSKMCKTSSEHSLYLHLLYSKFFISLHFIHYQINLLKGNCLCFYYLIQLTELPSNSEKIKTRLNIPFKPLSIYPVFTHLRNTFIFFCFVYYKSFLPVLD